MSKVLIVEDELSIAELEKDYLELSSFEVEIETDGQQGLEKALKNDFDMIILDIMLPGVDGFEICKQIREAKEIPILMVSARKEDIDKIRGLGLGADDYITKPFNPLEVVARVKTQLRRYQRYNNSKQNQTIVKNEYDIRGLIINRDSHKCFLFGKEISLTPIEFSILWYLCEHQGKVVSSEELFEAVWKEKYLDNNNTVMAHIGRLREKMNEPAKKPKFIKTVWGVGYEIE